jgi:hypothetical protein
MEPTMHNDDCPECQKRKEAHEQAEEAGLQILVALMPLLTITFFGNLGLF